MNGQIYQIELAISGQVQGVCFRETTCDFANRLGVVGKVDNTPQGTVAITAQGSRAKLNQLLEWCKKGPAYAKVEKVEEKWQEILTLTYKKFNCPFH